jgi:hypothetical protein
MDGRTAAAYLGVAEQAPLAELRAAYRARVRATHPDTGGDPHALCSTVLAYRTLTAGEALQPARSATRRAVLTAARHVDCYDSTPRRCVHTRSFAEVLRDALGSVPAWSPGN